jgi:large subunit ribosomal protein L32e
MHPSGYREVRVFTPAEMEGLNPAEDAIRIGASVGNKKRQVIQEQALSAGLKVLNPREITVPGEEVTGDD